MHLDLELLGHEETALGLVPDLTGTKPLLETVGYARALDITATARVVEGAEAHDIGLVNVLCDTDDTARLDAEVAAAVERFTAPVRGAVVGAKQLLLRASEQDLDAQRADERRARLARLREMATLLRR